MEHSRNEASGKEGKRKPLECPEQETYQRHDCGQRGYHPDQTGGYGPFELQPLIDHVDRVLSTFEIELRARLVFVMPDRHAALYSNPAPFGEAVEDAFPSVAFDVSEAAKCCALGRWTACVMHVMRVLEAGVKCLAAHLGVPPAENWNSLLNQMESSLRQIGKNTGGPEAEQWAGEAGTHFRFIKTAWRNHAMHATAHYDEDRAVAIFDNARSFMQHLAEKLSE